MAIDILATYHDEKNNQKLIKLPDRFFDLADQAIYDMQLDEVDNDLQAELKEQNANSSSRALEMLSDLRLKKILKGAIADAYREKPEHARDYFTEKELKLYKDIVEGIRTVKGRKV